MKKVMTIIGVIMVSSFMLTSCGGSSEDVDICKCITEAGNYKYMQENLDSCRDAISKELGVKNWETVYSKEPEIRAKFEALTKRCKSN